MAQKMGRIGQWIGVKQVGVQEILGKSHGLNHSAVVGHDADFIARHPLASRAVAVCQHQDRRWPLANPCGNHRIWYFRQTFPADKGIWLAEYGIPEYRAGDWPVAVTAATRQ